MTTAGPPAPTLAPGVESALQAWATAAMQPGSAPGLFGVAPAAAPAAATLATLVPHQPQVSPPVASFMTQILAQNGYWGAASDNTDYSLAACANRAGAGTAGAEAAPNSPENVMAQNSVQAAIMLLEAQEQEASLRGQGAAAPSVNSIRGLLHCVPICF